MVKDKFAFENIQKVQLEDNVDEANNDINVLRYNSRMIPMPKIPNIKSPQQNSHINIEIEQENIESDRAGK